MQTQPQFNDLADGQVSRIHYAERKRAAATGRERVESVLPGQPLSAETQQVLADFGHAMQCTNVILADLPGDKKDSTGRLLIFTEAMRLYVDVLIGIAGERTDWFEAGDKLIAAQAGRAVKWVQRTRDELSAYQKKYDLAVVDIEDHKYSDADGAKPHRYRLHVARQAAIATVEAREAREWHADPGRTLATSARNVALPNAPLHRKAKARRNDAEASINRNLKHARTLLAGVRETYTATGYQVEINLEHLADLEAELKALRALAEDKTENYDSDYKKKEVTDINLRRRERAAVSDEWERRERTARARASEAAENESVEGGVVKMSTVNDSTESTTYEKTPAASTASVPFMITHALRRRLTDLGYTDAQIDAMKPEAAQRIIAAGTRAAPLSSADPDLYKKYRAAIDAARARHAAAGADTIDAWIAAREELGEFDEWGKGWRTCSLTVM